ncbi:hypothetical protein BH10BAC2_BH10BAC2_37270 [soil metagenome]
MDSVVYISVSSKFMDTPYDIEVTDRQSFINFLELLRNDYLSNQRDWENPTIDRFLEAMSAYTNDIQGFYDNTNQNINADTPSWKVFADIIKGAKIYE